MSYLQINCFTEGFTDSYCVAHGLMVYNIYKLLTFAIYAIEITVAISWSIIRFIWQPLCLIHESCRLSRCWCRSQPQK